MSADYVQGLNYIQGLKAPLQSSGPLSSEAQRATDDLRDALIAATHLVPVRDCSDELLTLLDKARGLAQRLVFLARRLEA